VSENKNKALRFLKSFLKFLLFLGVGIGILYFVYLNQEAGFQKECAFKEQYDCEGKCIETSLLNKLINDFGAANFFWLFLVCIAFMVSNLSRSLRWILLIRQLDGGGKYNPKWYNAFLTTMVGYLVNLALPRAGEFARPATLAQYEKLPLDKTIGTVVTDRIIDMLMLLLVVGISLLLQFSNIYNFLSGKAAEPPKCNVPLPETAAGTALPIGWILLGLFVSGILGLFVLYLLRERLSKLSIYKKIQGMVLNFIEGIKTIFALRRADLIQFLFHTVVIWLMYFLMTYLCFFAYPPTANLGMMAALLAFVFGSFGILVPSPGGMGTYQIAVTAALVIYGVAKADAFAFSNILFFTINLFCNVFFGLLAYMLLPILNRKTEIRS
jgi:glycosyltransferase 2 family protein